MSVSISVCIWLKLLCKSVYSVSTFEANVTNVDTKRLLCFTEGAQTVCVTGCPTTLFLPRAFKFYQK